MSDLGVNMSSSKKKKEAQKTSDRRSKIKAIGAGQGIETTAASIQPVSAEEEEKIRAEKEKKIQATVATPAELAKQVNAVLLQELNKNAQELQPDGTYRAVGPVIEIITSEKAYLEDLENFLRMLTSRSAKIDSILGKGKAVEYIKSIQDAIECSQKFMKAYGQLFDGNYETLSIFNQRVEKFIEIYDAHIRKMIPSIKIYDKVSKNADMAVLFDNYL